MGVTIDGEIMLAEQAGLRDVGGVLDQLAAEHRLVTSLVLDGREPDLEDLARVRTVPLQGHVLYLETATPAQVGGDVLGQALLRLDAAERSAAIAADLVQQTDPAEGVAKLSEAFVAWSEGQHALQQVLALFGFTPEQFDLGRPLKDFAHHLREMKQAVAAGDFVTLADVLQYDLPMTLTDLRRGVQEFHDVITARLAA